MAILRRRYLRPFSFFVAVCLIRLGNRSLLFAVDFFARGALHPERSDGSGSTTICAIFGAIFSQAHVSRCATWKSSAIQKSHFHKGSA
jgi:hypothetical protein